MEKLSGCETVNKLWSVALECNIDKPGVYGIPDRVYGMVQCSNIRDFLIMASLKCWKNDQIQIMYNIPR
jgi:hypothetical protein